MIRGKLRTRADWITEQDKRGDIQLSDTCTKTSTCVIGVIQAKKRKAYAPLDRILDAYPVQPPELVHIDLTEGIVIEVIRSLSGGAGTGGTDLINLQH